MKSADFIVAIADIVVTVDIIRVFVYNCKLKHIAKRTNEFCKRNGG